MECYPIHCRRLLVALFLISQFCVAQDGSMPAKRPVTVADAIGMTRLGIPDNELSGYDRYLEDAGLVAHFSPNGKRFFVVLKAGDLGHNANRYWILLFETAEAFHAPHPDAVLKLESSTNDEAIKKPKWLGDDETICFIGQSADGRSQVYAFHTSTKRLDQLTNHPTSISDYDITNDGKTMVFKADPPVEHAVGSEESRRTEIIVTTQGLGELLRGGSAAPNERNPGDQQLFAMTVGRPAVRIPIGDVPLRWPSVSISPDGRYAVTAVFVRKVPAKWSGYKNGLVHSYITAKRKSGEASTVPEYILVNLLNGTTEPLLGVPWSYENDNFVWSPNEESVIVSGAYLPLDVADAAEREIRSGKTYVVEVNLKTKEFRTITDQKLSVMGWNRTRSKLLLRTPEWAKEHPLLAFERTGNVWREAPITPEDSLAPLRVSYEEDMNNPPRLFVSDAGTHEKRLLVDLNPQFAGLAFGHEEAITWKASDGHEVSGGLYLPPDYKFGVRYPLVIQTHLFDPGKFWIDGPWSSAFAAQPLAGHGFVVLQIGSSTDPTEDERRLNTPQEGTWRMTAYEGAIDYLDQKGLIDRQRVGIIGFSRTVYHVAYTLTHSKYHFAAATLADGMDAGYFQYRAYPHSVDEPLLIGGPPVGQDLLLWLRNSPAFNLDKVEAAVRIETYGSGSVLEGWEWFQGLSELQKPVDFIYLPDAQHTLVKPWERMASQQGNVDWFCFWLKGEVNPDSANREQNERWEALRSELRRNPALPEEQETR
jgi:dipeptidyl aminopeptidase/acylaminoacyl peptidase